MKRNVYLQMMSLSDARAAFFGAFDWSKLGGVETEATAGALGRVTAAPVFARLSSPGYHGAAMDGYAVLAESTFGAAEEHPLRLTVGVDAFPVNTGHPLPEATNAVIMIEHVEQLEPSSLEIRAAAFPWQHVRRVGEDIVAGELVLPSGHCLSASDLAALLMAGVFRVELRRRPRVAILATGSELVDWPDAEKEGLKPGAIVESNSVLLSGLVEGAGGVPIPLPREPDELERVTEAIAHTLQASDIDMLLVNAGASAGSKDFTAAAVGKLGDVLVHGVEAMPGKPTILGRVSGKPVVGTPGYPVSAWVAFDQFVKPVIERLHGSSSIAREEITARAGRRIASKLGHEEFLRVHLGRVGEQVMAMPLHRGAGSISSLVRADGLLRIPPESDGIEAGEPVRAELLRPRKAMEGTLVVVGSHDITLDLIAERLPRQAPGLRLSTSNVGSLAGLLALRDGRSHLGGTHLLDPETGEYNVSYLARYLPERSIKLVTLAHREQGLLVKRGNPKGIRTLEDVRRKGVMFVNRQGGSGTRVLLDYQLEQMSIDPDEISGYDREEYTHMAVAVQVASGGADAGLGILAAAKALGLDFVPIATERYDLAIPEQFFRDPRLEALLEILELEEFQRAVSDLGGYHIEQMGRVISPIERSHE